MAPAWLSEEQLEPQMHTDGHGCQACQVGKTLEENRNSEGRVR